MMQHLHCSIQIAQPSVVLWRMQWPATVKWRNVFAWCAAKSAWLAQTNAHSIHITTASSADAYKQCAKPAWQWSIAAVLARHESVLHDTHASGTDGHSVEPAQ
jgi:hypothetical protein